MAKKQNWMKKETEERLSRAPMDGDNRAGQYLIKAAIHQLRRVLTGAGAPSGVLELWQHELLLLLLLQLRRPPCLLLLLGLQRPGDLGDGDEAVGLAERQRVPGLEQLHPRHPRRAAPLPLRLLVPRPARDERDVVARVGAHDLGGAGGPVEALDAAARVLQHHRRRLRRLTVAHRTFSFLLGLRPCRDRRQAGSQGRGVRVGGGLAARGAV